MTKEEIFKKHFINSNVERHGMTPEQAEQLYMEYKNNQNEQIREEFDSALKVITGAMEEYCTLVIIKEEIDKAQYDYNESMNEVYNDAVGYDEGSETQL